MKGESCTMSYYITSNEESKTQLKSSDLWGGAGEQYTVVSNYFIKPKYTKQLGLTPVERDLILVILTYKHNSGLPFPSYKKIADDMGVKDIRHIKNMIKKLEEKGLLIVIRRKKDGKKEHDSNQYDFSPLIKKLENIAMEVEAKKTQETPETLITSDLQGSGAEHHHPSGAEHHHPSGAEHHPKKKIEKNNLKKDIYTPLTPQKRKNEQQEHKQENQGQGQNNIIRYIRDNFNKEQQAMLLSIYDNEKRPKAFNIYFLKAYKKAYPKVKQERRDLRLIKSKLIELLKDIEERKVIIKESLTGLMIYRLNNDKPVKRNNEQPENKEVIPEWFKQSKGESHKKNKQTSYETDHSKYDFSKRRLSSADELLKTEESH